MESEWEKLDRENRKELARLNKILDISFITVLSILIICIGLTIYYFIL